MHYIVALVSMIMSKNIFKGNIYIAIHWWQGLIGSIFVIHEVVITGVNNALLAALFHSSDKIPVVVAVWSTGLGLLAQDEMTRLQIKVAIQQQEQIKQRNDDRSTRIRTQCSSRFLLISFMSRDEKSNVLVFFQSPAAVTVPQSVLRIHHSPMLDKCPLRRSAPHTLETTYEAAAHAQQDW
jgi:hypothetical protein